MLLLLHIGEYAILISKKLFCSFFMFIFYFYFFYYKIYSLLAY